MRSVRVNLATSIMVPALSLVTEEGILLRRSRSGLTDAGMHNLDGVVRQAPRRCCCCTPSRATWKVN